MITYILKAATPTKQANLKKEKPTAVSSNMDSEQAGNQASCPGS